jgi:threonine/homoserine/homoserine lactone efflux protein
LPPFLDPSRALLPQLLVFALGTLVLDGVAMSLYALSGGALRAHLADRRVQRGFSALVGGLLVLAAVLIALPHRPA